MFYYKKPFIKDQKINFPTIVSQTGNGNGGGDGTGQEGVELGCSGDLFSSPGLEAVAVRSITVQITTDPNLSDLDGCSITFTNGSGSRTYDFPDDMNESLACPSFVAGGSGQFTALCLLLGNSLESTDCALDCTAKDQGTVSVTCPLNT